MTEQDAKQAKINIDGKEYSLSDLSDQAKAQVVSLQVVDAELQRMQRQAGIYQTARNAYLAALRQALPAAADSDA